MIPKGKLIVVGGAESKSIDTPEELYVLNRILKTMRGKDTVIEIIPTASQIPETVGKEYDAAFHILGCKHAGILPIVNREDTMNPEFMERVATADGIMFSGGDQSKLADVFLGTKMLDLLKRRYRHESDFVIAGTSAGAMAQSERMINGGTPLEAIKAGKAMMMKGLGFIDKAIIDSHFINRGRFGRLMVAVAEHPDMTGIGVSEDTGVIITEERYLEVIGSGLVVIMDGTQLRHNSVGNYKLDPEANSSLNLEHMIFHLLSKGMSYDMETRKMIVNEMVS